MSNSGGRSSYAGCMLHEHHHESSISITDVLHLVKLDPAERHCVIYCPHSGDPSQQHAELLQDFHDAMTHHLGGVACGTRTKRLCSVLAIVKQAQMTYLSSQALAGYMDAVNLLLPLLQNSGKALHATAPFSEFI